MAFEWAAYRHRASLQFGLDYFAGVIGGSVGSYYEYPLIVNNERNRYVYATNITKLALIGLKPSTALVLMDDPRSSTYSL